MKYTISEKSHFTTTYCTCTLDQLTSGAILIKNWRMTFYIRILAADIISLAGLIPVDDIQH